MVITRSRASSLTRSQLQPEMSSAAGEQYDGTRPSTSDGRGDFVDVRTSTPPLPGRVLSAGASPPSPPPQHGRESPADYSTMPHHGRAPPVASPLPQMSAPVVMTDQQLVFLLQSLRSVPPSQGAPPPPTTTVSTNFANCTARFNGSGDVSSFIDAIGIYKDCVGISDDIALRGLPMLLTDFAATWWQGVKHSIPSWEEALHLLRQTFGPRLPPHRIYREVFSREQAEERTDVFVCRVRALLAQLPPCTLPENPVQLDMVYGLLHKRIRERVARNTFTSFSELLQRARVVEDILEEVHTPMPAKKIASTPAAPPPLVTGSTPSTTAGSSSAPKVYSTPHISRSRPRCSFCKFYGHTIDDCRKFNKRPTEHVKSEPMSEPEPRPSIACFGCGTPGVIRSKCMVCKENRSAQPATSSAFQSVSAVDLCESAFDPRVRPILSVEVFGAIGTALIDTGAKQSVASVSLTQHLRRNGQVFECIDTELKFADGTKRVQNIETGLVNVKVQGVTVITRFIVLPGATESLLGMNFIRDAGMVLDFERNRYSLRSSDFYDLQYERSDRAVVSSAMSLRECEGTLLSPAEKGKLAALLDHNADIFSAGGGPTPFAVHRIDTGNAVPISTPPYRVTPAKKEIIRAEIDKMLELEVIEEAESEWASPVVLVPKKNGETRFCVDYRKLNAVTRTDKYPLPLIDEILSSTRSNCVMSTIDLKSGYWQVTVAPEDRHKTAFVSPFGTFQFRRMPFGLKNSPSTFQRLMDRFRSGLKDITVVAYLDDILVISDDFDKHLRDLHQVFDRLRQFNLKANREKCVFARDRVVYLGHVITNQGIEPDPSKVQAVIDMEHPTNLKELKTFLQTCAWFRKFIPQFSEVALPLTDLTKKNRPWKWGEDEVHSYEELKRRLTTSPILRQPDFEQPFIVRTDASAYALGAVLMQGPDPKSEKPIEYASRLLTSAERNYSTTEREALAVVWALEKFRGYLEGAQIRVATDHQPLKWLLSLKTPSGRLARWALKIQAYNLDVDYTPGKANVVADTLSRPVGRPALDENPTCDICPVVVDLPQRKPVDIRDAQMSDPEVNKIIQDFESPDNPEAAVRWTDRGYYLSQGILYRCDPDGESEEPQLVVPESLRAELMKELHDAPTAGHLGLERTLQKIKERYYFKNMRSYVAQYIKSCDLCQKFKATNLKPAGLLQTPVPQQRFEVLAMDLFGPLPEGSKGERWIFLIEDTASRWVELFPLAEANAENCAKILIEEVFLRYGFPRRVISDNGTQFVSAVMQKAMHVLGVTQNLTPVYHPECNPAERKNREMKQMLAILIDPEHRRWPEVLPAVRFALNTAPNQGTGQSAAFLTFARQFRSPVDVAHDLRVIIDQENYVPQITPYLRNFAQHLQEMKWRVESQQDIRKETTDKSRRAGPNYQEGDLVLVESHRLSQASKGFTTKFAPRREGPYRVHKVVSPTTYEVVDKEGVPRGKYHASALTPYVGASGTILHSRKKGRPRRNPKPVPESSTGLEGEDIAPPRAPLITITPRTSRLRRPPARLDSFVRD